MSQFTASEVRDAITWKYGDKLTRVSAMLTAYADLLETREKAVPVAWSLIFEESIGVNAPTTFDRREDAEDYADACAMPDKCNPFPHRPKVVPLYTHPAPSDAERLADQRDDAFQQAVQEARRVWMDEFPCDAGHDHVTPFDQFLYGNRPCMKAQPPVTNTASEVRERKRFEDWYTTHTFNYSRDPIGSRDCSLQWEAWKAALAAHSAKAQPNIPDLTDEEWEILFHLYPELKARLQKVFDAHSAQAQPHDLIKTGDPDAAPSICDANGEVVLAYCRKCRQGEGDLAEFCPAQPSAAMVTEALLRDWFNLLCHAGIDAREEKANNTLHRIMDITKQVSSEIAKYENVAQAQPSAASVPTMRYFIGGPKACAYVDKFEHVEAVITALCKCTGDARDDYTSTDLLASERVR